MNIEIYDGNKALSLRMFHFHNKIKTTEMNYKDVQKDTNHRKPHVWDCQGARIGEWTQVSGLTTITLKGRVREGARGLGVEV